MRRRDFLRRFAGVAAAPVAVAVAVSKPKRSTAMAENFRRTYGPMGTGKTYFYNPQLDMISYAKADAERTLMIHEKMKLFPPMRKVRK